MILAILFRSYGFLVPKNIYILFGFPIFDFEHI